MNDCKDIFAHCHEPCNSDLRTSGTTIDERLEGHFCSDTVFNLSNRVLSENEIKILEKGVDFAPIQQKTNEPELRKDFEEFYRCVRTKWNFRIEPSQDFGVVPAFARKSFWKPPLGNPNLEVFLSQVESEDSFSKIVSVIQIFSRDVEGSKILSGRQIYSH